MAVIAKMNMSTTPFADGTKVNLHCVYDTDLAKEENEDVRFTKATPWGQAEMTMKPDVALPPKGPHDSYPPLYLLFTPIEEQPLFSECFAAVPVVCASVLDTGYQKTIELAGQRYGEDTLVPPEKRIADALDHAPHFNLKMGVDNAAASVQFEPQKRYWVAMMPADDEGFTDVLGMARKVGVA